MKSVKKMTVSPRKGTTGTITKKMTTKTANCNWYTEKTRAKMQQPGERGGNLEENTKDLSAKNFGKKETFRRDRSRGSPEKQNKRTSEQPR